MRFFIQVIVVLTFFGALPVFSQETPNIRFVIVTDREDIRDKVVGASLVYSLREDGNQSAQDYVSAAQADYGRILAALYDEAYFGGVIQISVNGREASTIPPLAAPRNIQSIELRVDPGPRFRFGQTRVTPLAPDTTLPEEFARRQRARTAVIRGAAAAGVEGWRDQGYAKAEPADQSIVAIHSSNTLDVDIRLAPGPRLRFGNLIVQGNEGVRTERIREIAGLPTGQIYSPQELDQAQKRLRRTGAFRSAALIEAETPNRDGTLDITAQVNEQKRRRLGYGIEAEADEGLALSAFWLHRNLLGGAERLRVDAGISGIGSQSDLDYNLGARFTRPATFRSDTDLYLEARIEQLNEPDFSSREFTIGGGLERYVSDTFQYSYGVAILGSEIEDDLGERDLLLLTFPLDARWDLRDDRANPRAGYFLDGQLIPYLGTLDAQSGARLFLDGRVYREFGDNTVLAFRGQFGSVIGSDTDATPASYLFYSGGGGTVRGQEYQSLAVELDGDDRIGGRVFMGGAFEVRRDLDDTFGLVAFYDVGYVGPDSLPSDGGDWHSGAGLGLRYNTGIGPIRLDVGVPVSGPETDSLFQIYIGIGQSF
ncbi:autotransporter assembly complex protein TamA [Parasulfitobacter algicola]|uniref:Outer membrane protein assembly factor n=1 Tax=Parasulfitobacter algicola TaxID=2614809 RepID=A0ABX2IRU5_9RHOB|nr:autotransporter assembly complex family protein [Sulfitobacter algicola]NSX55624.1 outer membrane protein assembly factor [Sulfitobacter algicola]